MALEPMNDARPRPVSAAALSPMAPPKKAGPGKGTGIAASIALILGGIYAVEGGYVDDPSDRGGATRYGVTENVARVAGYSGDMRDFPMHCDGPKDACADTIYVRGYIQKPGFMALIAVDPGVGWEMTDTAVNGGPCRPIPWFRAAVNSMGGEDQARGCRLVDADMIAYSNVRARLGGKGTCLAMLAKLDAAQEAFYRTLAARNPSQRKYLRGWLNNRIGNVPRKMCERAE